MTDRPKAFREVHNEGTQRKQCLAWVVSPDLDREKARTGLHHRHPEALEDPLEPPLSDICSHDNQLRRTVSHAHLRELNK
jgi:hypothetical protein